MHREKVLGIMMEVAQALRVVETLEKRNGRSKSSARGNDPSKSSMAKERPDMEEGKRMKEVTYCRHGEVGHTNRRCSKQNENWCHGGVVYTTSFLTLSLLLHDRIFSGESGDINWYGDTMRNVQGCCVSDQRKVMLIRDHVVWTSITW